MSSDLPVITLHNVGKLYRLQKQLTMKEMLPALFSGKKTIESRWVFRSVNLTIKKGETVGVLGPNGAGKSTLLKLIAGVSKPTEGKISVKGRLAPLIELGAGFHPELTGRENIFLNGVILGMRKAEIKEKFDNIVQFSELQEYIDTPVKHYSSGMYLRLAFAVAIHTDPDILLVDEILAVGDQHFKRKCFAKWSELKRQGVTSILISHDTKQIQKFCNRALYLHDGMLEVMPSVESAVERYERFQ